MEFSTEMGIFLAYACGLLLICFFGKLLLWPVKWILKLVGNSLIGGCILVCVNAVAGIWGFVIPINFITAAIAGLFGIPGIVGLSVYFIMLSIF